jgi:competence protein ComEC
LFLGLGYVIANIKIEQYNPFHFTNHSSGLIEGYIGEVISEPEIKQKSIKTIVNIIEIKKDGKWIPSMGKCLIYFQRDSSLNLQYHDQITFIHSPQIVKQPANFGEFNYKRYLAHHYIYHQVYLKTDHYTILPHIPSFSLKKHSIQLRKYLLQQYVTFDLKNEELAIVSALTLGKKNLLNSDLKQAYSSAGAMHILAVSGLHVGIILLILQFSLSWLKRIKHGHILLNLLLIIFIWVYAFISGLSPSVLRAATMFSFLIMGKVFHKKSNIYNTLALSAFVILFFDPYMLLEVGFQLSYLAVIGIIYLYPYLYKIFHFKYLIIDKAWSITCVSVSAQIATAPLGLLYFHQFPSYFLLSNLIVIPAAFIIIFIAIGFQIATPMPLLASFLSGVLHFSIKFLNKIVHWVQQIPNALITGLDITIIETWLIYLIIGSSILWLTQYKNKFALYTLLFTLLLIASQTQEKWSQLHQKQITFYNTGSQFSMEYTYGKMNLFIAPSELTQNKEKMQFHIFHHWWERGISMQKTQISNPDTNAICLGNTRILFIDNDHLFSPQQIEVFQPHIVYVNTSKKLNLKQVRKWKQSPVFILGIKTYSKTYDKLTSFCNVHHLKFYSIKKNGALKVELNKQLLPQLYTSKNFIE